MKRLLYKCIFYNKAKIIASRFAFIAGLLWLDDLRGGIFWT